MAISTTALLMAALLCITTVVSRSWFDEQKNPKEATSAEDVTDSDGGQSSSSSSQQLSTKEEQIALIESDLAYLRENELATALHNLHRTNELLKQTKSRAGWLYYSAEEKERIRNLDSELERNQRALAQVHEEEKALEARLKPMYGIVSYPFYVEQRNTIRSCVAKVQELSYNNAWYSSLFETMSNRREKSLSDIIIGFFIEWLVGYIFMYPFAVGYYAFWAAPWSIYSYSSGASDVVLGAGAWLLAVAVMMLPIIGLLGGVWFIFHKYGDDIKRGMERMAEEQRARREAQQQQQRVRIDRNFNGNY